MAEQIDEPQFIMTDFLLPEEDDFSDEFYYQDDEFSNESSDDFYANHPRNQADLFACYPTRVDSYERITEEFDEYYGPAIYYDQYIIYVNGTSIMVDTYYKEDVNWSSNDFYELKSSKTLTETLSNVKKYDGLYPVLIRAQNKRKRHIKYITYIFQPHFKIWLGKAREKIVARESHPDRVNELLESGVDLDDIESVIDSKLAVKLSW